MKLFEGKTKAERNKMIAAMTLCGAALIVLFFAFGRGMFSGSSTTSSAKPSPTPKTTAAKKNPADLQMPSPEDQMLEMTTQPIVYNRASFNAPDPGRNIFAFYEPPKATPTIPPTPIIKPPTPQPSPTPPDIMIAVINPQSVYAGSNGFRLELAGDRFTPDTKIYFEQQELPSSFVSEQRMTADIPAVLIRGDGKRTLMAQTADGTKHSNQVMLDIQPPPKPSFQYIGMIARKRSNNDTAYFKEPGKELPTSARLNDVVGARFRVISISAQETVLEDVSLGFKHKLALYNPPPTTVTNQPGGPGGFPGGQPGRGGFPNRETYVPANPSAPSGQPTNQRIPGIPDNIPRYIPPQNNTRAPSNTKQQDVDDDDGID